MPTFTSNYLGTPSNNFSVDQSVGHVAGNKPSGSHTFFSCAELGHMMRNCPQTCPLESRQQPSQEIVPTRNGNNGLGRRQIGRGENHRGRGGIGNGNRGRGNTQPGREVARADSRTQYYAFLGKNKAETFDALIACTILVCDRMTNVLFDLGSTYSYVSMRFTFDFKMFCDILDDSIRVSTPVGESVIVTHVYRACLICLWDFRLGLI